MIVALDEGDVRTSAAEVKMLEKISERKEVTALSFPFHPTCLEGNLSLNRWWGVWKEKWRMNSWRASLTCKLSVLGKFSSHLDFLEGNLPSSEGVPWRKSDEGWNLYSPLQIQCVEKHCISTSVSIMEPSYLWGYAKKEKWWVIKSIATTFPEETNWRLVNTVCSGTFQFDYFFLMLLSRL